MSSFSMEHFNRGSGIIEFDVLNFSTLLLDARLDGPRFVIQDMYFWINMGKVVEKVKTGKRGPQKRVPLLSFWLMTEPRNRDPDSRWYCFANCDFQLVPKNGDPDLIISWKQDELFCAGEESCGYDEFEEIDCLCNSWKDVYTPDDMLHLRVVISNVTSFRVTDKPSAISRMFIKSEEFNQLDVHHMLGREEGSDYKFLSRDRHTGEQRILPMHSQILIHRCPVFRKIFAALAKKRTTLLECAAFDLDAMREILSFLYRFEFQLDPSRVPMYVRIARKLRIEPVRILCCRNISVDNCLIIMMNCLADPVPHDETWDSAVSYFRQHAKAVIQAILAGNQDDLMSSMTRDFMKKILVNPLLECREILIYNLVMYWIGKRLGQQALTQHDQMRDLLQDSIYNIRFTCMTLEEYTSGPAKGHLLTQDEKMSIFMKFSQPDAPGDKFKFCTSPRTGSHEL